MDHNRAAVQEIVIQYLKHTDCDTAVQMLYALAFRKKLSCGFGLNESSIAAGTKKNQAIVVKLMNDGYKFANGDRGGVVILYQLGDNQTIPDGGEDILAGLKAEGEDAQETRALSLVELILPFKNHSLAGEFFLYLMQKLTSFISSKKEELQKKGSSKHYVIKYHQYMGIIDYLESRSTWESSNYPPFKTFNLLFDYSNLEPRIYSFFLY